MKLKHINEAKKDEKKFDLQVTQEKRQWILTWLSKACYVIWSIHIMSKTYQFYIYTKKYFLSSSKWWKLLGIKLMNDENFCDLMKIKSVNVICSNDEG